ncbi:LEM-3-like GIY-YIG domain-containing protein [Pontibaca methylaminivorans]|uniref:LEM-3-like GIY-YIG domain-containing protein n=1 Tax=Pontibaca methylaminivorans TaxID=515897 RepID=UPI002FD8EBC6
MSDASSFPTGVGEKLLFYVYRLIDPRNGETFYVGKGRGNRVFQHVNAVRASDVSDDGVTDGTIDDQVPDDDESLKVQRILDIRRAGLGVIHIIHRHGIEDARTAFEVEAALIDVYAGLANAVSGHHSNDRGPMHALEIINKYALPEVVPRNDKLMLININSADHNSDDELLDRVRFEWRVSKERAQEAELVLAVIRGVVHGVFVPEEWLPAIPQHFPGPRFSADPSSRRFGFNGYKASDNIWDYYVGTQGKRLPETMRFKGQNPIRYYNC